MTFVAVGDLMRDFEQMLDHHKMISAVAIKGANIGRLAVAIGAGKNQGHIVVAFNAPGDLGVNLKFKEEDLARDPHQHFRDTLEFLNDSLVDAKSRRKIIVPTSGILRL